MSVTERTILDLCCGGGGASVGYFLADFKVTGIDIEPQPDYPFEFIRADVLTLPYDFLMSFDAIHASVPCEGYCTANHKARLHPELYPDLYHPVKAMLIASGKPWVMENVIGSPVKGFRLCGTSFGLGVFRHRVFETNFHVAKVPACGCSDLRIDGDVYMTVAGNHKNMRQAWKALGTPWITDPNVVKKAIPPAYTQWIGGQMRSAGVV